MKEEVAVRVLSEVKSVIDEEKIRCWLDCGGLLGAVRDGKLIPCDTDIDLSILHRHTRKLLQQIPVFQRKGFSTWVHCNNITLVKNEIPITFGCFQPENDVYFHIDWPCLNFFEREIEFWKSEYRYGVQIFHDIATYRELQSIPPNRLAKIAYYATTPQVPRWLVRKTFIGLWKLLGGEYFVYAVPKGFYDNLESVTFYGMEFKAPCPVEDYLAFKYGNWEVPDRSWDIWSDDGAIVARGTPKDSKIAEKMFNPWLSLKDLTDSDER